MPVPAARRVSARRGVAGPGRRDATPARRRVSPVLQCGTLRPLCSQALITTPRQCAIRCCRRSAFSFTTQRSVTSGVIALTPSSTDFDCQIHALAARDADAQVQLQTAGDSVDEVADVDVACLLADVRDSGVEVAAIAIEQDQRLPFAQAQHLADIVRGDPPAPAVGRWPVPVRRRGAIPASQTLFGRRCRLTPVPLAALSA